MRVRTSYIMKGRNMNKTKRKLLYTPGILDGKMFDLMKCVIPITYENNPKTLDELIRLSRKYRKSGDTDILPVKNQTAFKLSFETFGHENNWLYLCDFVNGALRLGATNDMIYEAFKAIGF